MKLSRVMFKQLEGTTQPDKTINFYLFWNSFFLNLYFPETKGNFGSNPLVDKELMTDRASECIILHQAWKGHETSDSCIKKEDTKPSRVHHFFSAKI